MFKDLFSFSICFRADDSYSDPNGEVMEGLSKCIERMITNEAKRDLVVTKQQVYVESKGNLFSSMLAKRARATQAPSKASIFKTFAN